MKVKEKMGDYFLDISKLIFGGIILSSIVNEPMNKWVIYSIGSFFSLWLTILGFVLISNSTKKEV